MDEGISQKPGRPLSSRRDLRFFTFFLFLFFLYLRNFEHLVHVSFMQLILYIHIISLRCKCNLLDTLFFLRHVFQNI